MTRVYVAATLPELAEFLRTGGLPAPVAAHAVTDDLRRAVEDESDPDVLEYFALSLAADESGERVRSSAAEPARRLVLAVDVADGSAVADPGRGPGAVVVADPLTWAAVAALQVDEAAAADVVAAGRDADDDVALDLLWYAPEEAADLLREAGRADG